MLVIRCRIKDPYFCVSNMKNRTSVENSPYRLDLVCVNWSVYRRKRLCARRVKRNGGDICEPEDSGVSSTNNYAEES